MTRFVTPSHSTPHLLNHSSHSPPLLRKFLFHFPSEGVLIHNLNQAIMVQEHLKVLKRSLHIVNWIQDNTDVHLKLFMILKLEIFKGVFSYIVTWFIVISQWCNAFTNKPGWSFKPKKPHTNDLKLWTYKKLPSTTTFGFPQHSASCSFCWMVYVWKLGSCMFDTNYWWQVLESSVFWTL